MSPAWLKETQTSHHKRYIDFFFNVSLFYIFYYKLVNIDENYVPCWLKMDRLSLFFFLFSILSLFNMGEQSKAFSLVFVFVFSLKTRHSEKNNFVFIHQFAICSIVFCIFFYNHI